MTNVIKVDIQAKQQSFNITQELMDEYSVNEDVSFEEFAKCVVKYNMSVSNDPNASPFQLKKIS